MRAVLDLYVCAIRLLRLGMGNRYKGWVGVREGRSFVGIER